MRRRASLFKGSQLPGSLEDDEVEPAGVLEPSRSHPRQPCFGGPSGHFPGLIRKPPAYISEEVQFPIGVEVEKVVEPVPVYVRDCPVRFENAARSRHMRQVSDRRELRVSAVEEDAVIVLRPQDQVEVAVMVEIRSAGVEGGRACERGARLSRALQHGAC